MNEIKLTGRLTKDPILRTSKAGNPWCTFGMAVDRPLSPSAQGKPVADFFNLIAFGETAENISSACVKGSELSVTGSMRNDNYEKDGQKIYGMKVFVNQCSAGVQSQPEPQGNLFDGGGNEPPF